MDTGKDFEFKLKCIELAQALAQACDHGTGGYGNRYLRTSKGGAGNKVLDMMRLICVSMPRADEVIADVNGHVMSNTQRTLQNNRLTSLPTDIARLVFQNIMTDHAKEFVKFVYDEHSTTAQIQEYLYSLQETLKGYHTVFNNPSMCTDHVHMVTLEYQKLQTLKTEFQLFCHNVCEALERNMYARLVVKYASPASSSASCFYLFNGDHFVSDISDPNNKKPLNDLFNLICAAVPRPVHTVSLNIDEVVYHGRHEPRIQASTFGVFSNASHQWDSNLAYWIRLLPHHRLIRRARKQLMWSLIGKSTSLNMGNSRVLSASDAFFEAVRPVRKALYRCFNAATQQKYKRNPDKTQILSNMCEQMKIYVSKFKPSKTDASSNAAMAIQIVKNHMDAMNTALNQSKPYTFVLNIPIRNTILTTFEQDPLQGMESAIQLDKDVLNEIAAYLRLFKCQEAGRKPRVNSYEAMTVKELQQRCYRRKLHYHGLRKAELVLLLRSKR